MPPEERSGKSFGTVALGSYDSKIIELIGLTPQTATRLGKTVKVDDGALTLHLFNNLAKEELIEIVDAAGPNPVWALTEKGRARWEEVRRRR